MKIFRKTLVWKLYPAFLLISFFSLVVIAFFAVISTKSFYLQSLSDSLIQQLSIFETQINELAESGKTAHVDKFCKTLSSKISTRITVILPSGKVIADSAEPVEKMANHLGRPEIIDATQGKTGTNIRFSETTGKYMLYVAVPAKIKDGSLLILRASVAVSQFEKLLKSFNQAIFSAGVLICIFVALSSYYIYWRVAAPLNEITSGVERFTNGELDKKIIVSDSGEAGDLAKAINQMAEQLNDRIRSAIRQSNEKDTILSSMIEGVIALDNNKKVFSINKAALKMLNVKREEVMGKAVIEFFLDPELNSFVNKTMSLSEPVEECIIIREGIRDRFIQAHGVILKIPDDNKNGAVIVLNDVTRLRHLENLRRDFVANVSHELKTPITSIKGFVETLLEETTEKSDNSVRFLKIVQKHADRMNSMIEDLLLLSKIEQDAERFSLETQTVPLEEILNDSIQMCMIKSEEKRIRIELIQTEILHVNVNAQLFSQAIVNLIDNAIKYSEPGSDVRVEVLKDNDCILVKVCDSGCGIAQEHLSRLGERFYRIDKARSRKQGGTGLGLAIVKHIIEAHSGSMFVESTPGKGSVFSIMVPQLLHK
ncbi:MAG: HAMP domain-containing protein [Candidatus Riflebacteria bacterium]|nr:HAMP domain-containing protein [Candidatus Riflebacteria bacterium]